MPTPTPPPPLPDPDDDIGRDIDPGMPGRGRPRASGDRTYPSMFAQLNRRAWIVIGALAVVIVAAIVVLVTRGSDTAVTSEINTERAAATVRSLLDGVDSSKELARCPFGSVSDVVGDLNDVLKFPDPTTDDIHRIVMDGKDSVGEVLCSAGTADDRVHVVRSLYVYATPVPKGAYPDYLAKTRLVDAVVKVDDGVRFNRGTIYPYCIAGSADIKPGCGADWVADNSSLVIGLQVTGSDVTAKLVTTALTREFETLATRLGGPVAPDKTSPDNTSPDNTSPDKTSPDKTSPDNTSPDNTSPDNTTGALRAARARPQPTTVSAARRCRLRVTHE